MSSMYNEAGNSASSAPSTTSEAGKNYLRYFESSCGQLVENEFNNDGRKSAGGFVEMGVNMRSPMSYLRLLELQRQQNTSVLKERAWQGA